MKQNIFTLDKHASGRSGSTWTVTHVPTGAAVVKGLRTRRAAIAVRDEILKRCDHGALATQVTREAANAILAGGEHLSEWTRRVDDYLKYEDFVASKNCEEAERAALAAAREAYVGRRFWFNEHSLYYGLAGKIVAVDKLDPPLGPEALTGNIEWSEAHTSLGRTIYLNEVTFGDAPSDLPWVQVRPNHEWRGRVSGACVGVVRVGAYYYAAHHKTSCSKLNDRAFDTLEAAYAEAVVLAWSGK